MGSYASADEEATPLGTQRFADLPTRPTARRDLTSLTLAAVQPWVPPFAGAFQAHRADWHLEGQPRKARRYTTYRNCPLPTPEDRVRFILGYRQIEAWPVGQGRLVGMGQGKAHQWMQVLLGVVQATRRALGEAPHPVRDRPRPAHRRGRG